MVPVLLITNATSRLMQDLERLGIAGEFDYIVNSSTIGCSKPQPQVFHHALGLVGIPPANALFGDDAASHIAAAVELGLRGHVYKGLEELRVEFKRYQLVQPFS